MRNESPSRVNETSDVNYLCAKRNLRVNPFVTRNCKLIYCGLEAFVKVQLTIITSFPTFLLRQL